MSEGFATVRSVPLAKPALPQFRRGNRMDVYERSRHQLHQRLREVLGPEEAGTLMAHLPAGGIERLATKDDIQKLELKMDAMRHELRGEIQEVRAEMHQMGRSLMVSFVTVMAIMNGILFAALRLSG
jgi:hypothetical protein